MDDEEEDKKKVNIYQIPSTNRVAFNKGAALKRQTKEEKERNERITTSLELTQAQEAEEIKQWEKEWEEKNPHKTRDRPKKEGVKKNKSFFEKIKECF